ncbi:MAG TPA: hypothetical protein VIQ30_10590 [Pseudonocardia sp.]
MSTTGPVMVSINNGQPVSGVLTIDTEMIHVQLEREVRPDMRWEFVDAAGHWHAYDKNGRLPTIDARSEHVDCPGGCGSDSCEGYEVTIHYCAICGEEIKPKTKVTSPGPERWEPGRKSWRVEIEQPVTDEKVSVRIKAGDRVFFGIAIRGSWHTEGAPGLMRTRTTLVGTGPLGERPAKREAAVA